MPQLLTARIYDRWMAGRDPHAALMRFLMSVPGMILVNTPLFRLPDELHMRPCQRLLDLGCGRASLLRILASRIGFEVMPVGLDASREMLRLGRRAVTETGEAPVHLVRGLATDLPFPDDTFHILLCGHVLKYLSDTELRHCLREIRRVLAPGGIAMVWEMAPTRSRLLNRFNRWVLSRDNLPLTLRTCRQLQRAARECSFDWIGNAGLRPFLLPPIPRLSLILGKAPEGWNPRGQRLRAGEGRGVSPETCVG